MHYKAVDIASAIEHTLLKPEATTSQIDQLCDEAMEHGFRAVCVNPIYVSQAAQRLKSSSTTGVVSVVGFPLGATYSETKAEEARRALGDGATEIDMVVALGALIDGKRDHVRRDIENLARVVHDPYSAILKVILETATLTDEQIMLGCRLCAEGEADYVKTSTGLHPSGGATIEHVRLLHRYATPLKVKAAGGIRTAAVAIDMLKAGAATLGTSSGVSILSEARISMG